MHQAFIGLIVRLVAGLRQLYTDLGGQIAYKGTVISSRLYMLLIFGAECEENRLFHPSPCTSSVPILITRCEYMSNITIENGGEDGITF